MVYIILSAIVLLILIIIIIRKIFNNKKTPSLKYIKKQIEELTNKINEDEKDYVSLYQLAKLKEQIEETEEALKIYEKLMQVSFFKEKEELEISKKFESFYENLEKKDDAFKYTLKIAKLDPNNMFYNIKTGTILCNEGYYILASDYFNKAILNKNEFDIDNLKAAAFTFFKIKDYKKSIVFLEELQKRLAKENDKDIDTINSTLISMYMISDELNIARSFIEQIIVNKHINNQFYIDRIYLHILYKVLDNEKFKELYTNLYKKYNISNPNKKISDLVLDYSFYSYFLRDISLSQKLFENIKDLNLPELNTYNFELIIKYLSDINKATEQLNKLRNMMKLDNSKNDNYEKYVEKEDIENWERAVDLWEGSFIDINYLSSLITIQNNINVKKILDELKIDDNNNNNNEMSLKIVQKVDKIYNMNIIDFKKLCQNLIRTKLSHSIIQEYTDNNTKSDYGDEVNYITYNTKGNKRDTTLISFKRLKKIEIGELIIRDFLMMINESGAKNGILIVPVTLSNSAKSYVSYNNKVTVYSRNQFNNLLKEEKL
ncbi:tetratricopeptide repeat protein [Brachyspira hyodysenteriae]|uniref:tetratricopeptide repeat protein n=1 Tax=Brachyspira hyodysenteriae TaxID=159 RepID=UPI00063D9432|nr:restriction endonuclease [Brachyspira hyodysenteriae]